MNLPEEIQKETLVEEAAGLEKVPEVIADFESIESYAENIEASVEVRASDFASENKVIEKADTFGLSEDDTREIRVKQKVDDELGAIESEADEAAKTAEAEIRAIIEDGKSSPENGGRESVATSEAVGEKEEMPAQHMKDDARYRKLTEDLSLQYLKTKDASWFNKNFSGEVAPSGYLLDRNGKETNLLPSQNIAVGYDQILATAKSEFERLYPDDASRYTGNETALAFRAEEKPSQPMIAVEVRQEKSAEQVNEVPPNELKKMFEQMGIESKTVPVGGGGEFSDVIVLSNKEMPTEKMVRVFRGANQIDASLLMPAPYAMRAENRSGETALIEGIKPEVEALAHRPTYENLVAYMNKAMPQLSDEEQRKMNDDLQRIEDGVLGGESVRKELIWKQIEHGGGVADRGISPYVSGSYDAIEAAAYIRGGGALVVMDIPISQIEDFSVDSSEVNIKGQPDPKYVTAVLPRGFTKSADPEKIKQDIDRALAKIAELSPMPPVNESEVRTAREQQLGEEQRQDIEQWKVDVELIRQKRTKVLIKKFPDVKIELSPSDPSSKESSMDVYAKAKTDIFSYYAERMGKIGRGGRSPEDYDFTNSRTGETKPFDKGKITDVMLIKLRELVENMEDREAERARNR